MPVDGAQAEVAGSVGQFKKILGKKMGGKKMAARQAMPPFFCQRFFCHSFSPSRSCRSPELAKNSSFQKISSHHRWPPFRRQTHWQLARFLRVQRPRSVRCFGRRGRLPIRSVLVRPPRLTRLGRNRLLTPVFGQEFTFNVNGAFKNFKAKKSAAKKWRHGRPCRHLFARDFFAIPFPLAIVPFAGIADFGNHP